MRLQASETVVPSGMVSALDNRSFLTVLSPPSSLTEEKRLDLKRKRKNFTNWTKAVTDAGGIFELAKVIIQ